MKEEIGKEHEQITSRKRIWWHCSNGYGNAVLLGKLFFGLALRFCILLDDLVHSRSKQMATTVRLKVDNRPAEISEPLAGLIASPVFLNAVGRPVFVLRNLLQLGQPPLGYVTTGIGLNDDGSIAHFAETLPTQPCPYLITKTE